jgi:hypothetical protein
MQNHLKNISLLLTLFSGLLLGAQVRISSEEELELLKDIPMEALYVHTPATLYMPGEYLYYSLYCINTQTFRLSELSEVAYLQLIGEDNTVVFTQKIDMEKGRGQGDYFFPTDLASGNYKLVAYTHWMKNAGLAQFFSADLTFLNPYRSDQNVFLNPEENSTECLSSQDSDLDDGAENTLSKDLGLQLEKSAFKTGEKISLQLKNFRGARGYGSYSLSVRKTDNLQSINSLRSTEFGLSSMEFLKRIPQRVNDILAIPEQRGELISGQVTTTGGTALADRWIAISLPGPDFQVKKVQTDEEGKFYTYLTRPYREQTGMASLVSPGAENVEFDWYTPYDFEGTIPCFYHFELQPEMGEEIRRRSIHNQIENSYFEVKPDTLQAVVTVDPFEGEIPEVYQLEDYTRFPTLEETLVELIEHVWVKREDDGETTFWVRQPMAPQGPDYTTDPPLVVVDGILVQDHNSLLGYDARKIRTIKVLRDKYQLGGVNYQGMVVIETIDATYLENWDSPLGTRFSFLPSSLRKNYFRQMEYSANVPDYRYQLLWEPEISIQGEGKTYSFYASQVPGEYEIRLEGYTTYGKPISLSITFQVESP